MAVVWLCGCCGGQTTDIKDRWPQTRARHGLGVAWVRAIIRERRSRRVQGGVHRATMSLSRGWVVQESLGEGEGEWRPPSGVRTRSRVVANWEAEGGCAKLGGGRQAQAKARCEVLRSQHASSKACCGPTWDADARFGDGRIGWSGAGCWRRTLSLASLTAKNGSVRESRVSASGPLANER
jgi:hypothetical protein